MKKGEEEEKRRTPRGGGTFFLSLFAFAFLSAFPMSLPLSLPLHFSFALSRLFVAVPKVVPTPGHAAEKVFSTPGHRATGEPRKRAPYNPMIFPGGFPATGHRRHEPKKARAPFSGFLGFGPAFFSWFPLSFHAPFFALHFSVCLPLPFCLRGPPLLCPFVLSPFFAPAFLFCFVAPPCCSFFLALQKAAPQHNKDGGVPNPRGCGSVFSEIDCPRTKTTGFLVAGYCCLMELYEM